MSHGNGSPPIPFQAPGAVAIVGQPVSVVSVYVPVITTFTCNCVPAEARAPLLVHPVAGLVALLVAKGILRDDEVAQALNAAATCPQCRKSFNAFQSADKVQMPISVPPVEMVPS